MLNVIYKGLIIHIFLNYIYPTKHSDINLMIIIYNISIDKSSYFINIPILKYIILFSKLGIIVWRPTIIIIWQNHKSSYYWENISWTILAKLSFIYMNY